MIQSLTVKNIALIDELTLDFSAGFNVLTGETGAGKSIIIGALGFLFGGKSNADIIREGAEEASVAGIFSVHNREALQWLAERDITGEGDGVLLRRSLKRNGRASAWINSTPVTRGDLADFTAFLVDIHGQHDHQSLFRIAEHRRFLDAFAGIEDEVAAYSQVYTTFTEKRKMLDDMEISENKRQERLDYLSYAIDEIEKAQLRVHEEEELEAEAKKLDSFEKLYAHMQEALDLCGGNSGAVLQLKKAIHALELSADIDVGLKTLAERMSSQYYELEDAYSDLQSRFQTLNFDEARRDEIQERLSLIYKLKKKYAERGEDTIRGVLSFYDTAKQELSNLQNSEANKAQLEQELKNLQTDIFKRGTAISQKRIKASRELESKIETVLGNLGMKKTHFSVNVEKKSTEGNKQKAGPYGFDDIEFLMSPNLGEPLKPLAKIASGGELSRVMLALKTVLAKGDGVETLIFDEIDTGIGGEVALSVAEHIKELARLKQILCVTHLAVIAAHAAQHIKIEKGTEGGKTFTHAELTSGEKRVEEIARMLSGDEASSVSLLHAKELLEKYSGYI